MKKTPLFTFTLLILFTLFSQNIFAQDSPQFVDILPDLKEVREIQYSSDGTRLAVADYTNIWLYDTRNGEATLLTEHRYVFDSVAFSPDGNTIASGSYREIQLWDANTGQHKDTLTVPTNYVESVAFSPDGNTLASGSWDGTVRLWDAKTGQHKDTLTGHTGRVTSVTFSPDGETLASGSWRGDKTVRLWDAKTGQHKATITGHTDEVSSVAFSPDGETLASGSWDGTVRLWDARTGQHKATITDRRFWVRSVAFSPDGKTLASGGGRGGEDSDYAVRLWDARTGQHKATLTGHTSWVNSVAFSPDGKTLASGSDDGTVLLWELTTVDIPDPERVFQGVFFSEGKLSFADTVVAYNPVIKNGEPHEKFANPSKALGAPDFDNVNDPSYVSLGDGGSITVQFTDNSLTGSDDDAGDLRIFEVGPDVEDTFVEISRDGVEWVKVGKVYGGISTIDLDAFGFGSTDFFSYVRLTDDPNEGGQSGRTVGSDIDAIGAISSSTVVINDGTTVPPTSPQGLQSDEFDGSDQNLQAFWHVQNGDKSSWELKDGQLVIDGGFNQSLWRNDTSTRFYQVTDRDQFTVETSMVVDYAAVCAVTGLIVYSPTTKDPQGRDGDWVTLKLWGRGAAQNNNAVLQYQHREREIVAAVPNYNPQQATIPIALRLERDGNDYEAWFKPEAQGGWVSIGSTTISLEGPLQVGLYVGLCQPEAPGHLTVSFDYFRTTTAGYLLSVPAGISLIHVPLKVTTVDGVPKTITSIADLYDALGGASTVNFLITYDAQAKEWRGYFGTPDTGTPADRVLTDDMGVIAALTTRVSVHLGGNPLGTNGKSSITLNQGINVVGLPLRDTRINRVSDLFKLDGIGGNTPGIILTDGREFKLVGRPGDSGDIEITGGQAFILTAIQAATVPISGEPWTNTSGTATAPPLVLTGIQVTDTTPVLGMRGAVVDDGTGLNNPGFRVTVKNISTGRTAAVVTGPDEVDYRLTIVDIETGQAATVGDILEISAHSTNPFIGMQPLRYTVTAEDVKRSLIQLPKLVAYEIPAETQLLANYPNPFNPETWIPYRLAEDAFVTLTIYDLRGRVVRTLDVGHRVAAVYESRSKAVYWDGRNQVGEQVASGVYFYHLSAGRSGLSVPHRSDYSDTRKMVILK